MTREDAIARVARGAAYMDRTTPGWETAISLPEFDMSSPCRCVLGQVDGDFYAGCNKRGFEVAYSPALDAGENAALVRLGFDLAPYDGYCNVDAYDGYCNVDVIHAHYRMLQEAWADEVTKRLHARDAEWLKGLKASLAVEEAVTA